jgi:hypothetical protein
VPEGQTEQAEAPATEKDPAGQGNAEKVEPEKKPA